MLYRFAIFKLNGGECIGIEHDCGAAIQQQATRCVDAELIKDIVFAARDAGGFHPQIGSDVIQPGHMQLRAAHADQITDPCAGTVRRRQQGTMHGHGLCRVFDTAGGAQPAIGAQRVVGGAVAARATLDALPIPCFNVVQQAHAALMRDVPGNPSMVHLSLIQHSVMATARRVLSR